MHAPPAALCGERRGERRSGQLGAREGLNAGVTRPRRRGRLGHMPIRIFEWSLVNLVSLGRPLRRARHGALGQLTRRPERRTERRLVARQRRIGTRERRGGSRRVPSRGGKARHLHRHQRRVEQLACGHRTERRFAQCVSVSKALRHRPTAPNEAIGRSESEKPIACLRCLGPPLLQTPDADQEHEHRRRGGSGGQLAQGRARHSARGRARHSARGRARDSAHGRGGGLRRRAWRDAEACRLPN